ncbi:hypothetical protein [Eubacterium sp.]
MKYMPQFLLPLPKNRVVFQEIGSFIVLFATKATTCYAGGKGKALARKEVTK